MNFSFSFSSSLSDQPYNKHLSSNNLSLKHTPTFFTEVSATMTLPFVRRITKEVVEKWSKIKDMPSAEIETTLGIEQKTPKTEAQMLIQDITRCLGELKLVGCYMKDMDRGKILFPAIKSQKEGYFVWELGEQKVQEFYIPETRMTA